MQFAKARYFMNQDVQGKRIKVPRVNECDGVRISKPKLNIYDEFVVMSSDFWFSEKGILWDEEVEDGDVGVGEKVERPQEHSHTDDL